MRGFRLLPLALVAVVVAMAGLSFAAVPLYRVFCSLTGFAGTPKIGPEASPGSVAQRVTVRFDAAVSPGLPWRFAPDQARVTLPLGQQRIATYSARNDSDQTVTGVALYNVTPEKAGVYFHKTACFCFDKQTLAAGADARFPLSFWVDPAMAADPSTADVHTVTLSYTFFRSLEDAAKAGKLASAGPHIGPYQAEAGARP